MTTRPTAWAPSRANTTGNDNTATGVVKRSLATPSATSNTATGKQALFRQHERGISNTRPPASSALVSGHRAAAGNTADGDGALCQQHRRQRQHRPSASGALGTNTLAAGNVALGAAAAGLRSHDRAPTTSISATGYARAVPGEKQRLLYREASRARPSPREEPRCYVDMTLASSASLAFRASGCGTTFRPYGRRERRRSSRVEAGHLSLQANDSQPPSRSLELGG